jgi:hypothetical protein
LPKRLSGKEGRKIKNDTTEKITYSKYNLSSMQTISCKQKFLNRHDRFGIKKEVGVADIVARIFNKASQLIRGFHTTMEAPFIFPHAITPYTKSASKALFAI